MHAERGEDREVREQPPLPGTRLGCSPVPVLLPTVCPEAVSWYLFHPESECRGDPVRDFHRVQRGYSICQTTRPLSWVECRGACQGQGCCQGLRLKRRKLTFECSDGTSFAEEVEKPTKCGCAQCA